MYNFDYTRAGSAEQAAQILTDDEDATLIAGGQTLIPTLKQRLAAPSKLVDISGIDDLRGITREGDRLAIGAMTRHAEVQTSDIVRDAIPGLAELAGLIGDPHVRHRGTLGGSVANNDPAADYPAALLALGATVTTNKREIVADDFFVGLFETALDEGEIVTRVSFPIPKAMAYAKHRNPASRYALAGVCVARLDQGVRVAVIGSGQDGVFRWEAAEQALTADFSTGALDGIEVDPDTLMSDIHGQADYRANLIRVMTLQAVGRLQG
ncbi:FAD binding domain-containing protein [Antarctobacter sp.]|uniref:FAD binding domain-containing protein n=1 Tax=Antarctobacter sp. TaxID=1872577 RepID=UPI003A8D37CB